MKSRSKSRFEQDPLDRRRKASLRHAQAKRDAKQERREAQSYSLLTKQFA
jgi:hypothetical protein